MIVSLLEGASGLSDVEAWLEPLFRTYSIGGVQLSFGRLIVALVLFAALLLATRFVRNLLSRTLLAPPKVEGGVAHSISTGVTYAGYALALLSALSVAGIDITNLAIVAGALSVGLGFGLQSIVNNFVSGLILLVERPVNVGDLISVRGLEGRVRHIRVRATEIETQSGASIIIPNSELITGALTNYTLRKGSGRITITIATGLKHDPDEVRGVLLDAATATPGLLEHPAPTAALDEIADAALRFSVSASIGDISRAGESQSVLRTNALKALQRAGIGNPHAEHDVFLRDLDFVRSVVGRVMEERARQAAANAANQASPVAPGGGTDSRPQDGSSG